jgi:predicted ATPase/DNA-binding SARP family transcriptional activator
MRFGLLGPLEVWASDGRPVRVPEAKVRALLAGLLINAGRVVSADRLVEDLWGQDLPANPAGALQTRVSQLRRALDDAEPGARTMLAFRSAGYVLDAAPDAVDATRFQRLVAEARRVADPATRAQRLTEALDLWRGPALADFADLEFAREAADRLEEQRLTAVEEQAEARLEAGEGDLLADDLADFVARHPLRERLRAAHMSALYRAGRQRDALMSYEELRRLLADELGVDPGPQLTALHQAILEQRPSLAPPDEARPHRHRRRTNLPSPPGELVGRSADLSRVRDLLTTSRLVTLTGPGGVGKTRLALEAARAAEDVFPDGAWLVELAGVKSSDSTTAGVIAEVVAGVLEVREGNPSAGPQPRPAPIELLDRLAEALRDRHMLVLLDNCEHVIGPAAEFTAALLRTNPDVRVLATSREPLGISGEHLWPVPPLDPPEDPDALNSSSAAQLFVQRARAAAPGLMIGEAEAEAITTICRRLDGIPLALELAATRVRALGVRELARRLDDRFAVLTSGSRDAPDRQQTLRAVIDWSWNLLRPEESAVLARLAVHADGCTIEAARAVCEPLELSGDDVLDVLIRLVDRSLVMVSGHGSQPRFRLLESVAAYGRERLAQTAGDLDDALKRHADYFTDLAERADTRLRGTDQTEWLGLLDAEQANLRTALEHAVSRGQADQALRLAVGLAWYWFLRGKLGEGHRLLGLALSAESAAEGNGSPLRHVAMLWRSAFSVKIGGELLPLYHSADDRPADSGHAPAIARAEWFLAFSLAGIGDPAIGEGILQRTLGVFRTAGDQWGTAATLAALARYALVRSELEDVHNLAERSLALFDELGDRWGRILVTYPLGSHAEIVGDYDRAIREHTEGLRLAEELALWIEVSDKLSAQGRIALLRGDYERSVALHEEARRLAAEQGYVLGVENADLGLGLTARRRGDLDSVEKHLAPWLDWQRSIDSHLGEALILGELGFVAELRGHADLARSQHRDGLAAARASGDPRAIAMAFEGLAGADALAGEHVRAAQLLGCATAIRASVGAPLPDNERGDVDRISARLRASMGADDFDKYLSAGREIDLPDMLEMVDAD